MRDRFAASYVILTYGPAATTLSKTGDLPRISAKRDAIIAGLLRDLSSNAASFPRNAKQENATSPGAFSGTALNETSLAPNSAPPNSTTAEAMSSEISD